ncbi:hypothetical protein V6N11_019698 [Hibiscus sabdariffa]|uniref:Reverse transcriptase n=1 Tax=Hibiscus sabdariffa TaxID=183260 RepID=A0ABR2NLT3_9ROSI
MVGKSVVAFLRDCFDTHQVPADLNHTVLVLIPKIPYLETFSQFRPISLCLVVYKSLMKVIVILTQEVIHSMSKKIGRKGLLALMINLVKAYDHLE